MPELKRLTADDAPAVLAFELENRAYFAASVSDRGDEFFDQFTDRHDAMLAEQEAGTGAFYVLVAEDGSVLGRFNLYRIHDGSAELEPRPSWTSAGWRGRGTGSARCARPFPTTMPPPRRCWPRPDSPRLGRPTRIISAASRAPGTSATLSARCHPALDITRT